MLLAILDNILASSIMPKIALAVSFLSREKWFHLENEMGFLTFDNDHIMARLLSHYARPEVNGKIRTVTRKESLNLTINVKD